MKRQELFKSSVEKLLHFMIIISLDNFNSFYKMDYKCDVSE